MERRTQSIISNANQGGRCVLKSHVIEKRVVFVLVLITCLAPLAAAPKENSLTVRKDN
jgi:hypothetical protein